MFIYICATVFVLILIIYSFINAKKTNERNIRVGAELVSKEIDVLYKKSLEEGFDKTNSLEVLSKKIDYFKQCISVMKVMLVKKQIDKSKIKKLKVLRIIILSQLMSFIHLYQQILSENKSEEDLYEKIKSISLSEIGTLDSHLNMHYEEYRNVFEKKNDDIPLNKKEEALDNFMQYYKTFIIKEING